MTDTGKCISCVYCSYDASWGRYECKVKKAATRFARPGTTPEPFTTPDDTCEKYKQDPSKSE